MQFSVLQAMKSYWIIIYYIIYSYQLFSQTPCRHLAKTVATQQNTTNPLVSPAHAARMAKYDVIHYHLAIQLERTSTQIAGSVRIRFRTLAQLDTFSFELHPNLTIDSVVHPTNGRLNLNRRNNEVNALFTSPLLASVNDQVTIYYRGLPPGGGSAAIGNGISNGTSPSWGNRVTWTLSQPLSAYEWFPCKQELYDKADSSSCWIITDSSNKAGSNGLLVGIDTLSGGKVRYRWHSRYPISYYLISVAVAQYIDYQIYVKPRNHTDSILIQNYVYNNPRTLPRFKGVIDSTAQMLTLFSELFGLYPFHLEKYGHCMAPFTGGMEHQTMTTLGFFDFELVAHELGHQWFGDNVTCKTWSDIFVNEGFATYSEYLALEALRPTRAQNKMNEIHTDVTSLPNGSIYFTDLSNLERIFDSRLSYNKGAAILHTLRFVINNDSLFFKILRQYQIQYKDSVAGIEDFKSVAESLSGINLTQFFKQWIYGEGFPIYTARYQQRNDTLAVELTYRSSAPGTPEFFTPLQISIRTADGRDTTIRHEVKSVRDTLLLRLNTTVNRLTVDPNNYILNLTDAIIQDSSFYFPLITNINETATNNEKSNWLIWPNPANETIYFSKPPAFLHLPITIWNVAGRQVAVIKSEDGFQLTGTISVAHLPAGIYWLRCGEFSTRIIRQ